MDISHASSNDHDPTIGISDGLSFIGAYVPERYNIPCLIRDGDSSTAVLTSVNDISGPTVTSKQGRIQDFLKGGSESGMGLQGRS